MVFFLFLDIALGNVGRANIHLDVEGGRIFAYYALMPLDQAFVGACAESRISPNSSF